MPLNFSAFFGAGSTDALRDLNFARPFFSSEPSRGPLPRFKRTREEVQNESDSTLDDPTVNPNGMINHAKGLNEQGGVSSRDAVYLDSKNRARQKLTPDEQERFVQQNVTSKYAMRVRFPDWMRKTGMDEPTPVSPHGALMVSAVEPHQPAEGRAADARDVNRRFAYMGGLLQRLHGERAAAPYAHLSPQALEQESETLKSHGLREYRRSPRERLSDALSILDRPSVNIATLLAPLVIHPSKHPMMAHLLGGVAGASVIKRILDMMGPTSKFLNTREALRQAVQSRAAREIVPAIRPSPGVGAGKR